MNKMIVFIFAAVLLGGCQVKEARLEYQQSAANYKQCLLDNPSAIQKCEALRLVMETDEKKYNNVSTNTEMGSGNSVLVQQRKQ